MRTQPCLERQRVFQAEEQKALRSFGRRGCDSQRGLKGSTVGRRAARGGAGRWRDVTPCRTLWPHKEVCIFKITLKVVIRRE